MASWEFDFVAEDFKVSSDESVGDASSAVYVGAFHGVCGGLFREVA
ncbi:MAG: hypothetical protein ACFE95_14135 [Candidatus Hodarchaeota archaeon]